MKVTETALPGVLLIEPVVFNDDRGFFMETYNKIHYADAGIVANIAQENLSFSERDVLRGLHLQNPNGQGKLVYVLQGEIFDAVVDVRVGSPDFGCWTGTTISDENKYQLYVPEGFAHGFCVTSETALVAYSCTDFYDPGSEISIAWNDPGIAIDWPIVAPSLSIKDAAAPCLADMDSALLPRFTGGSGYTDIR